nr:minor capsid protein [Enterococcus faecium]
MYDAKYKEFIEEYFPSFDYAKVNRLLQMRSDIFRILAESAIDADVNKYFSDRLEDILQRSYVSNANVFAQILNVDLPNYLSKEELERYLNYPWSGKTFSRRLWGNISSLEQKLSNAITTSVASGEGVLVALRTMREDPEICDMFKREESKYNKAIENLVRTEYAKFAQDGIEKSYIETGVDEYNVLTAKDEKVCSICGGKAKNNPYKLSEAIIGENRAPFHGRCRCTDVPNMPKLGKDIDEEYERLFGDLLDEFAHDSFGINLKRRK